MLDQIKGLHHVTSMARDARQNNVFFTDALGLRRVKKTVNFDAPDVYHLYYGDELGRPGSIMTYFPFPGIASGRPGTGEVAVTAFSIPEGSLDFWQHRLTAKGVSGLERQERFGEQRLAFQGPDGEGFALVVAAEDERTGWTGSGVPAEMAIRGFHSVSMRLADTGGTEDLLRFMGYGEAARDRDALRLELPRHNGAGLIDLIRAPDLPLARQGAGSVHHVAFSVDDRAEEAKVRGALIEAGYHPTPVIDRNYFWSVYFRAPGGVLFEIATDEPGFAHDEDAAHLGEALKLPAQHEHLRAMLEQRLAPLEAADAPR